MNEVRAAPGELELFGEVHVSGLACHRSATSLDIRYVSIHTFKLRIYSYLQITYRVEFLIRYCILDSPLKVDDLINQQPVAL